MASELEPGIVVEGFAVAADWKTGELSVAAFMPGEPVETMIAKLRGIGFDEDSVRALEKSEGITKARHDVRAEGTGQFRVRKPHEKLALADAWQHGGAVHPALLPKP
jgi:ABC-type microcin C transport system permease subunit YejB